MLTSLGTCTWTRCRWGSALFRARSRLMLYIQRWKCASTQQRLRTTNWLAHKT